MREVGLPEIARVASPARMPFKSGSLLPTDSPDKMTWLWVMLGMLHIDADVKRAPA